MASATSPEDDKQGLIHVAHAAPSAVTYPRRRDAVKPLVRFAAPIVSAYLAGFLLPFTTLIYLGSEGSDELAAGGLAFMTSNITGFSIGIGLLTGVDTLASQAFGARVYPKVGTVCLRGWLVTLIFSAVFVTPLWLNGEAILKAAHQPHDVAVLTGDYLRIMVLGLVPYFGFESGRRFLQTQGITRPMLIVSLLTEVGHVGWCWLFIKHLEWGVEGAAVATVLSLWISWAALVVYIVVFKPHTQGTWPGFSRDAFRELRLYMKLAAPGAAMLALEWSSFEVTSLFAGALGKTTLSAHAIFANIVPFAFMYPLGLGIGAGTLIGNLLGQRDPASARRVAQVGLALALAVGTVVGAGVYLARRQVALLFTSDEEVIDEATGAMHAVAMFIALDALQGVFQGVYRGTGKQSLGAIITVLGYYCIDLPLAYCFAFVLDLELPGLWEAMTLSYLIINAMFIAGLLRMDFNNAAELAYARATAGPAPVPDGSASPGDVELTEVGASSGLLDSESPSVDTMPLVAS